jgi:hypothetical protein
MHLVGRRQRFQLVTFLGPWLLLARLPVVLRPASLRR